jgi:sn-glycerol 3-phosphate transport system substrate-binding protein
MWLTPESQIEWQVNAGYLPLNQAGLLASSQSTMLGTELEAIHVAILELTNKPVTRISAASSYPQRAAIRQIVNEELESVWQDRKPSKLALDDAVARSRSMSCSPSC